MKLGPEQQLPGNAISGHQLCQLAKLTNLLRCVRKVLASMQQEYAAGCPVLGVPHRFNQPLIGKI